MKNIHVLPTSQPSRLYINMQGILSKDELKMRLKNQNIYIISYEEIKEGDWVLNIEENTILKPSNDEIYDIENSEAKYYEFIKKIILTTDVDLIKDGVQAIDDEFLEWFLNNQSCDSVEVKDISMQYHEEGYSEYKIIIPKEEQTKCYCGHTTYCDCGPEEPKQETLEEAAETFVKNRFTKQICGDEFYPDIYASKSSIVESHILFAKWQQEKMYSEEEVKKIIKLSCEQGMLIQRTINDKVKIPYTRIKDFTIKMFEQFKTTCD